LSLNTERISVAHLTDVFDGRNNSGTARVAKELITQLAKNSNVHQTFIHFGNSNDPIYRLPNSNEIIIPMQKFGVANHFFSFLTFWIRNIWTKDIKKFDVVHWHSSRIYPFFFLIPAKKNVVTLYDATNRIIKEINTFWTSIFYWNLRISIFKSDFIIGTSKDACRKLNKISKFPDRKIRCIYLGSNFDTLQAKKPNQLYNHKDYFLCVSRWQPYKNVAKLVNAYYLASERDFNLPVLILVGKPVNGYCEPALLINEFKLEEKVFVLPDLSDEELAYLYDGALINISPSLHEGFGLPVLEGLKRNCPSLDHVFTSTSEVSGNAGIHIDMESLPGITDALLEISQNRELLTELRLNASKRAKLFTWQQTVEDLLKIYSH
jgi:glycosyltransferase involved in cell wall biosynthesis